MAEKILYRTLENRMPYAHMKRAFLPFQRNFLCRVLQIGDTEHATFVCFSSHEYSIVNLIERKKRNILKLYEFYTAYWKNLNGQLLNVNQWKC